MSSSSVRGFYASSCPEPVDVTVNNTIVSINGGTSVFQVDTFSYSGSHPNNQQFTLSHFPYEPRSVQVFLNSGAQRYGIDFQVLGNRVLMTNPLVDGDSLLVNYISVVGTLPSAAGGVGSIVSSVGESLGSAYLRLDGVSPHVWTNYSFLRLWFWEGASEGDIGDPTNTEQPGASRRAALLKSGYTSENFTLVFLQDTSYDGTQFVTLNKFINVGGSV